MAHYETPYALQLRRKRLYAALLGTIGIALPIGAVYLFGFPDSILLWAVFALTFLGLELYGVEINDRLISSPATAVLIVAAIAIGPAEAVGGLVAMSVLGFLQMRDVADRRLFQPLVNLGIMTMGATVTALGLVLLLPENVAEASLLHVVAAAAVAAAAGDFLMFATTRTVVRNVFGSKLAGPWTNLDQIVIGFTGLGAMGGLLGYAYIQYAVEHGPNNAMLLLVVATLMISHLFYASLGKIRVARESMLATLVKTLEAKDLYTRGHTERVATFAVQLAQEMKLSGDLQERIRHAALIHDLGKLAVPRELLKKRGRLTSSETDMMRDHVHHIDDLLDNVEWLHPLVAIASDHHAHFDGGGYHGSHSDHGETPSVESRVLAIADAFDAMTSNRPYRMALTQEDSFRELRRGAGTQFDPELVEAFISMIKRSGLTYGALIQMSDEEARQAAEDRGWVFRD